MKKCPFCAEEIKEEAIKCRFCGEFLTPPSQEEGGKSTGKIESKAENSPATETIHKKGKKQKDKKTAQPHQSQPIAVKEEEKQVTPPQQRQANSSASPAIEMKEATKEKPAAVYQEKAIEEKKNKKDWVLIIAIIVFGILLLIIQFSKQLGIEGFP